MKKILTVLLLVLLANSAIGQDRPYLQVSIREGFLLQKIEFLDGPKVLNKVEMQTLMAASSQEIADLYRKSVSRQKLASGMAIVGVATTVGTTIYILTPRQQITGSNLFWPLLISSVVLDIGSRILRQNARNLAREAVDSYNFDRANAPIYFDENRIDVPLFSHIIRF
jgi:hypothetical protein